MLRIKICILNLFNRFKTFRERKHEYLDEKTEGEHMSLTTSETVYVSQASGKN